MICQKCGCELRDGALFCVQCGTKAEIAPEIPVATEPNQVFNCPRCGTSLQNGMRFCVSCGASVNAAQSLTASFTKADPMSTIPFNPNEVQPIAATSSMEIPEETFAFTYLGGFVGGGRLLAFIFGNPLTLSLTQDRVIIKCETHITEVFEIPYNEIIAFQMNKQMSIGMLAAGLICLILAFICLLGGSLYCLIGFAFSIGLFLNLFPTKLSFQLSDGRKFSRQLKKIKPENIDAKDRLIALMNHIVQVTPKLQNITKKQSQFKRYVQK